MGDHVTRDQIVAIVQTDKAEVELPVPFAGTVTGLGGAPGDMLPVGAALLELSPDDASVGDPSSKPASPVVAIPPSTTQVRGEPGVQAAPPVRKLARELGVDLEAVTGSGPGGRVTANDVRAAASPPKDLRPPASNGCRCGGSGARWRGTWPRRGAPSRTSRCSTRSTPGHSSTRSARPANSWDRPASRSRPSSSGHRCSRSSLSRSSTRASTKRPARSCTTRRSMWAWRSLPTTGSSFRSSTTRKH